LLHNGVTVRTALGRELHADHLQHLNINTQQGGIVYLRGPVHSQEKSTRIAQMVRQLGAAGEE
jgi:osmotically-inducible protein OsmY